VSNDQRKVIYQQRNDILDAQDLSAQIKALRQGCFTDLVRSFVPADSVEEQWDVPALQKMLAQDWQLQLDLLGMIEQSDSITDEDVLEKVLAAAHAAFDAKVEQVGPESFTQFERAVLLQNIDSHWRDHLSALDYLRQGIHLRGFAQKQPKQEYKREAFELFGQLLDAVKNDVTRILMNVKIQSDEQIDAATQELEQRAESISNVTYTAPTADGSTESSFDESSKQQSANPYANARVGRNDPCPCGSGKKYKLCHGKLS